MRVLDRVGIPLVLIVASCSSPKMDAAIKVVDEAREHASNCMMDTLYVPLQNSGNCLAAARNFSEINDLYLCRDDASRKCDELHQRLDSAAFVYWRAIGESLYTYGPPVEFADEGESPNERAGGVLKYMRVEVLELAFKNCLEKERKLQDAGVDRKFTTMAPKIDLTTSIFPPLRDDQICIREGYASPSEVAAS